MKRDTTHGALELKKLKASTINDIPEPNLSKAKLIEQILRDSKQGMSAVQLSEKTGISRYVVAPRLTHFVEEGKASMYSCKCCGVGNVYTWTGN